MKNKRLVCLAVVALLTLGALAKRPQTGNGLQPWVIVAATDSSWKVKRQADVVCTGKNDLQQIQAALDMDEGPVYLAKGVFDIGEGSILIKRNSATLLGAGRWLETIIKFSGDAAITNEGGNHKACRFEDFMLWNISEEVAGVGLDASGLLLSRFDRLRFYRCDGGLKLGGPSLYNYVTDCYVYLSEGASYGFRCGPGVSNDNTFIRCRVQLAEGATGSGYAIEGNVNTLYSCNTEGPGWAGWAFDVRSNTTGIYSPYIEDVGGLKLSGGNSDKTLIVGGRLTCQPTDIDNQDGGKLIRIDAEAGAIAIQP